MKLGLLCLLLALCACSRADPPGPAVTLVASVTTVASAPALPAPALQMPEPMPYPEAKAPNPFPATAPGPDSDCSGLIETPPGRFRDGVWALGQNVGQSFTPILFFNTERAARACSGSSGLPVRHWRGKQWI